MENRFGPWQPNIAASERLARLRSLRAIVMGIARWDQKLQQKLLQAETLAADDLDAAFVALETSPTLTRRRVLASYGELMRQAK
jgi:hypothetical protein